MLNASSLAHISREREVEGDNSVFMLCKYQRDLQGREEEIWGGLQGNAIISYDRLVNHSIIAAISDIAVVQVDRQF